MSKTKKKTKNQILKKAWIVKTLIGIQHITVAETITEAEKKYTDYMKGASIDSFFYDNIVSITATDDVLV
jgi:hypothetical protein